jgi:hypothetical protein
MSQLVTVEVMGDDPDGPLQADSYDYNRLPAELRDQAMLAQGTVLTKLGGAVERVIDAGNTLRWAKATLPHGEYLPWVQQACGLKPRYAQQLARAAEWVNAQSIAHLENASIETLFLLSADATAEEVREWFMERCAAGDVPSRAEVAARKRSAGQQRPPQPAEAVALAILRKGEIERIREALALAERSAVVTADQVMAEQRLRELPKGSRILGADADFHRMKDGSWVRMPHAGRVDIEPEPELPNPSAEPEAEIPRVPAVMDVGLMPWNRAAARLDVSVHTLRQRLSPAVMALKGEYIRNGYRATKEGRGMVRITPV